MAFEEVLLKDILTLESVVLISCFRRLHVLTRMMSVMEMLQQLHPSERLPFHGQCRVGASFLFWRGLW